MATGCKPTEKNYRSAYDKALEASLRKQAEMTESSSGGVLETMDGPRMEIVEGDTLYVSASRVRPENPEAVKESGAFGLAIGRYGMPTNARRQAEELKNDFGGAFVASDGEDNYYVVVSTFETLPEGAGALRRFRAKKPGYPSIGLPSGPVVLPLAR